jgi:hypothetical protein
MKKAMWIGLTIAGALLAQPGPQGRMWGGPGGPGGPGRGPGGPGGPEMRNPVTGAPYSGTETVVTQQVLSNGNTIQRQSQSVVYRDSFGRVRLETTRPARPGSTSTAPEKVVRISDPVAGVEHNLDVQSKTSHDMVMPKRQNPNGTRPANANAGRGPRPQNRTADPNVVTENLGMQTVNGVAATGTRVTRTIPVGEVGNAQPMQIIHETWRSDDLKVPVMVKTTDPRFGTTVTQLTNVTRAEPDVTLFQVPSDYTKTTGPGRGARGAGRPPVR